MLLNATFCHKYISASIKFDTGVNLTLIQVVLLLFADVENIKMCTNGNNNIMRSGEISLKSDMTGDSFSFLLN